MNTVQDAYTPPLVKPQVSKFWFRFTMLAIILAAGSGVALFTAYRVTEQMRAIDMNSSRRPAPRMPMEPFPAIDMAPAQ